ncbi:MAG: hypothetical protein OSA97_07690 [Nevskia sp.]|nr:hypothetical protein [Nevskia sp.]
MDLASLQYQLSQESPLVQVVLSASALLLILLSTWFWSVTLDRLFDFIGERLLKNRAASPAGGRS